MDTFIFVLAVINTLTGHQEWSVLDSQLTEEDCMAVLAGAPPPFMMQGVEVSYSCELEDVN
jgi:hypothetical protein